MRLNESANYAVVSNTAGVYIVSNLATTNPEVVQLSDSETGPIAIDAATGVTYIHVSEAGRAKLLEFDDISQATDLNSGRDIASDEYSSYLGDQANQLHAVNHEGKFYLVTLYQGGGFLVTNLA